MGGQSADAPKKRSLAVAGHVTSVSLEGPFWIRLGAIAQEREQSVAGLIAEIDAQRGAGNLSSALRLFVLRWLERRAGLNSAGEIPAHGGALGVAEALPAPDGGGSHGAISPAGSLG